MSIIDVSADITIAAEPTDVASVMFDPQREPEWVAAVTSVDVLDPALQPGARVRRTGRFLGRELSWTTAVQSVHFPHLLALRVDDGPFTGVLSYQIQRAAGGSAVRIHGRGEAAALGSLPASLVEPPVREALGADLARLKALVEGR
jgi:Polyketide cyclase / dehydrase and lipid transport